MSSDQEVSSPFLMYNTSATWHVSQQTWYQSRQALFDINHPTVNEWNTANDNKREGVDVDKKRFDEKHKQLDVKHAKSEVNNAWLDH